MKRNCLVQNIVMIIHALVLAFYGIGDLLFPEKIMTLLGVTDFNDSGLINLKYLGATWIGMSIMLLLVRNAEESPAKRAIIIGMLIASILVGVVVLNSYFLLTVNNMVWVNFGFCVFLTLSYSYFLFAKKDET